MCVYEYNFDNMTVEDIEFAIKFLIDMNQYNGGKSITIEEEE